MNDTLDVKAVNKQFKELDFGYNTTKITRRIHGHI